MKVIRDHWFRPAEITSGTFAPCAHQSCGQPQEVHVEAVGEWMDPRHFFVPALLSAKGAPRWPLCARCDRRWGHSTHYGSKENRTLWWDRWNRIWHR